MPTDDEAWQRPPAVHPLTRRELLKLMGAGVAVSLAPELAGCNPSGPDDERLVASATWVRLGRRDDLVVLTLGIIGLEVRDAMKSSPPAGLTLSGSLYLARTGGPAYLLVDHPPQHLLEEAFLEPQSSSPPPATVPAAGEVVQHRLAGPSRLSFFLPDALLALPYELEPILATLTTLQLHVAPNAYDEPQGGGVAAPAFDSQQATSSLPASTRLAGALRAARARQRQLSYLASNPEASTGTATGEPRDGPVLPTVPTGLSTQIELPFRLLISPNQHATWQHAAAPVRSSAGRVELWHTRMTAPQGWQRTIRALAARDSGFDALHTGAPLAAGPFRASLEPSHRKDLVHLTTNFALQDEQHAPLARAVGVDTLMLSSLGGWLDAHGDWNKAVQGSGVGLAFWDHKAVQGRDQKVTVAEYGYLYPFGHLAMWVTVTERKFFPGFEDTAYLWQYAYLVVKEPLKTYAGGSDPLGRGFPFTSVRFKTLVTPHLDQVTPMPGFESMPTSSWALVNGEAFPFEVESFDHDGNAHTFTTAGLWLAATEVAAQFPPHGSGDTLVKTEWESAGGGQRRVSAMKSQKVALAPSQKLDDTTYSTVSMAHTGLAMTGLVPFVPQLDKAELALDAVRVMTGADVSTSFSYLQQYVTDGFDALDATSPKNLGGVFMGLADLKSPPAELLLSQQSDRSGGFASPDLVVQGLSRAQGLLSGDPSALMGTAPSFKASDFFNAIGAKLFGILSLGELIADVLGKDALQQAPKFVTQALDAAETVFHTFQNAGSLVDELKARLSGDFDAALKALSTGPGGLAAGLQQQLYARLAARAGALGLAPAQLQAEAAALGTALTGLGTAAVGLAGELEKVAGITPSTDIAALADDIITKVTAARDALSALGGVLKSLVLPIDEGLKAQLLSLYDTVAVKLLPDGAALDAFKLAVKGFVNAEEAIKDQHVKLDWSPTIGPVPRKAGEEIFWPNDPQGFKVGVELRGKAAGGQPAGASIYASLTDFELRLIGKDDFIKLVFDKLVFKAGSDGKATVDVGFRGVHFEGPLSFIETIKQLIPLDGFSDPPGLQVSPQGISASYTLPLPNVAIGVFSLENLSISAGFSIPFIGKSLTVEFAFCSRESPFVLTVCMLGGGGFVGLTIAPDGVRLLEISLEAQACLAVDFGVASGSVSIALGIYFAIELGDCKLTGYFRLRGVVQVLGIIHASIDLRLELSYESSTGKVVGRASLEIEVSVLCFSASVTIETEKKFSGGNSDPTFRQVMAYDLPSGYAPWDDYCGAFALVAP